jgi:threonine dehydratase
LERALSIAQERNPAPIDPFDDPLVIAGQGTIDLEILEDPPDVDVVIVPVGGAGLLSGIATASKISKPSASVLGVSPQNACAMYSSFRGKKLVVLHERPLTIADGIRSASAGELTLRNTLE